MGGFGSRRNITRLSESGFQRPFGRRLAISPLVRVSSGKRRGVKGTTGSDVSLGRVRIASGF